MTTVNSVEGGSRQATRRRWAIRLALALGLAAAAGGGVLRWLHPFLSVSEPVAARVLVVEGWLPDYALEEALAEYRRGAYDQLFTTGGPIDRGAPLVGYGSFAELAAATLIRLGAPTNAVTAVPSSVAHRNRTFGAAVALHDYCRGHERRLEAVNLVSVGAHARRSRLCFRRALGPAVSVGVIAVEDRDYDPRRWWRYSEGLKTAFGEPIGLLYAWLAVDYGN